MSSRATPTPIIDALLKQPGTSPPPITTALRIDCGLRTRKCLRQADAIVRHYRNSSTSLERAFPIEWPRFESYLLELSRENVPDRDQRYYVLVLIAVDALWRKAHPRAFRRQASADATLQMALLLGIYKTWSISDFAKILLLDAHQTTWGERALECQLVLAAYWKEFQS